MALFKFVAKYNKNIFLTRADNFDKALAQILDWENMYKSDFDLNETAVLTLDAFMDLVVNGRATVVPWNIKPKEMMWRVEIEGENYYIKNAPDEDNAIQCAMDKFLAEFSPCVLTEEMELDKSYDLMDYNKWEGNK